MFSRVVVVVVLVAAAVRLGWAGPLWMEKFPVYPGAKELCDQHVTGNSGHIVWNSYTSNDAPERVRAFYAKRMTPEKNTADELTVRIDDRLLSVYPASSTQYPTCGSKPPSGARTVIIVSHFIKTRSTP